jgi:aspartyl-tRNA synthetase
VDEKAKKLGASGLGIFQIKGNELKGPLVKFLGESERARLREIAGIGEGDALFVLADASRLKACAALGTLRLELGKTRGLLDEKAWEFLWVVHFPLVEWDEEENRWSSVHHPFTSPVLDQLSLMETDPGKVAARAYDVVLNGNEVGGGSIRIHDPSVQAKAFACLGIGAEEAKERFGFFIDALSYGTPRTAVSLSGWTVSPCFYAEASPFAMSWPFPRRRRRSVCSPKRPTPSRSRASMS